MFSCSGSFANNTYIDDELGFSFNYPRNWRMITSSPSRDNSRTIEFRSDDDWLATVGVLSGNSSEFHGNNAVEILEKEIEKMRSASPNPEEVIFLQEPQSISDEKFDTAFGIVSSRAYISNLNLPVDIRINYKVFKSHDNILVFAINAKSGSKIVPSAEYGFNMIFDSFKISSP